jgi:hypothetical protein
VEGEERGDSQGNKSCLPLPPLPLSLIITHKVLQQKRAYTHTHTRTHAQKKKGGGGGTEHKKNKKKARHTLFEDDGFDYEVSHRSLHSMDECRAIGVHRRPNKAHVWRRGVVVHRCVCASACV